MIEQTKFSIKGENRLHLITIIPVVISVGGLRYATGKYNLKEGTVGIGSIEFDDDMQWQFDGFAAFDTDQLESVATFIRKTYGLSEPVQAKKVVDKAPVNIMAANKPKTGWFGALFG